ncbi:MAG: glycosyl hydrolase 53 family protein [Sediminibacterium sp.]
MLKRFSVLSYMLFFALFSFAQQDKTENILGADISFLPELEAKGIQFSDKGKTKDAILLLKEKGFNYIRLRIFVNPAADSGYSPGKGFCDLSHTLVMAKRVKVAGLKFLLDFHYSDTWADPGKQIKPAAWVGLGIEDLKKAIYQHTTTVLSALKAQGTYPDMVQVGNEIDHGMVWPEGNTKEMDVLASLIQSGIDGVRDVNAQTPVMIHIACGGQNKESRWFLDQLITRGLKFDVIGQSYYPQWHGTLEDLEKNLQDLSLRYSQDLIVVEYTAKKKEVNQIAFSINNKKMRGTFIWEPLNTWEFIFEKDGKSNALLDLYPAFNQKYIQH